MIRVVDFTQDPMDLVKETLGVRKLVAPGRTSGYTLARVG